MFCCFEDTLCKDLKGFFIAAQFITKYSYVPYYALLPSFSLFRYFFTFKG